jgi:hypothetical protein
MATLLAASTLATFTVAHADVTLAPKSAPQKLALLVGIDNYQADIPGNNRDTFTFPKLHCSLDSQNLKRTLMSERYGFKAGDVRVLTDQQSTKAGIIDAFNQLIARARPGDTVVFMYSGHGDEVPDQPVGQPGHDEADGFDEVLVPYDWNDKNNDSFLRDDDIHDLLEALDKKMTKDGKVDGNITLLFDCCHSGTISRGRLVAKGRGVAHAPLARSGETSKGPQPVSLPGSGYELGKSIPYVLISACQSDQSAYETYDDNDKPLGGALVYNFCKLLNEPDFNPNQNYSELYDRLKIQVKADKDSQKQTPVIEGHVNEELFGGDNVPTLSSVRVADFDADAGTATIDAGRVQGVVKGAKYAIYKPSASVKNPGEPLAQATIDSVDFSTAKADITIANDKKLTRDQLLGAPLVLTEYPNDDRLKVLLDGTGDLEKLLEDKDTPAAQDPIQLIAAPAGTAAGVKAASRGKGASAPAVNYDYYIAREPASKGAGPNQLVLRRADDSVVMSVPENDPAALRRRLVREWRWQTLVPVDAANQNDASQVDLKIIPYVPEQVDQKGMAKGKIEDKPLPADGQVSLHDGDYFRIEVTNRTASNLWITVIDIDSEGNMSPVFPQPHADGTVVGEENFLKAGETLKIAPPDYTMSAGEPLGTDVYKVLATPQYVNFMPLLDPSSAAEAAKGARGPVSALANLLMNASLGTRAPRVVVKTADWFVVTKTMEILPAAGKGPIAFIDKGKQE